MWCCLVGMAGYPWVRVETLLAYVSIFALDEFTLSFVKVAADLRPPALAV